MNENAIVVPVLEREDLNGDGDTRDVLLHSQFLGHTRLRNLHVEDEAVTPAHRGFLLAYRYYLPGKPFRKVRDLGFHVRDPVAGEGIFGFASARRCDGRRTSLDLGVDYWSRWAADGDTMVVSVPESAQGNRDLDGDGEVTGHVAFRIELGRELRGGQRK